MEYRKYPERCLRNLLSTPFIYAMIVPLVILDVCVEIYHRICFPLYGIKYIKRGEYIRIDRQRLPYLAWWDKINCAYCGYANGLAHYLTVIAAETEKYWCGIKQQGGGNFHPPAHQTEFLPYGDKQAFEEKYCKLEEKS